MNIEVFCGKSLITVGFSCANHLIGRKRALQQSKWFDYYYRAFWWKEPHKRLLLGLASYPACMGFVSTKKTCINVCLFWHIGKCANARGDSRGTPRDTFDSIYWYTTYTLYVESKSPISIYLYYISYVTYVQYMLLIYDVYTTSRRRALYPCIHILYDILHIYNIDWYTTYTPHRDKEPHIPTCILYIIYYIYTIYIIYYIYTIYIYCMYVTYNTYII